MEASKLTNTQRREMLTAYLASGKSSAVVARKYKVSPSYPRWLKWRQQQKKLVRAA